MRIAVYVTPGAHHASVERLADGTLRVAVTAPPREGLANDAVIAAVARYLGVPRSRIRLRHGARGRRKILEVDAG